MDVVVKVDAVSKSFRIPHERHTSLKQSALNLLKKRSYTTYRALEDISFDIYKGEFFGIVGKNGSGKSTLLKIIADIYSANKGGVTINGRLSPFIELGVGFNPELSGRENIFLNGVLLGMSRSEIEKKYDAIVAFAELEDFIDQKLKNYSSGMQVRLAFSVAIQAEAEILLIDEVLAVGDVDFQRKCFDVFMGYKDDPNKTVILVTHDMSAAERFCDRIAVINDSKLIHCGDSGTAVSMYYQINALAEEKRMGTTGADDSISDRKSVIGGAFSSDTSGKKKFLFRAGEQVVLNVQLNQKRKQAVRGVGFAVFKDDGSYFYGTNSFIDDVRLSNATKQIRYTLTDTANILPGKYYVKFGVFGRTDTDVIEFNDRLVEFRIDNKSKQHGVYNLDHEWSIE